MRTIRRLPLVAGLVAALVAGGCGSSSPDPAPTRAGTAGGDPAPAPSPATGGEAADTPRGTRKRGERRGAVTRERDSVRAADVDGADGDGANRTGAGAGNPCKLVTRAEARAIVGDPVAAPRVAPLGPTCIYATPDKRFITLAVQPVDVAAATRGARGVIKAQVGGRNGVCLTSGSQQTLLVQLSSGRALAVTAPCPIGTGFAAKALSRLSG